VYSAVYPHLSSIFAKIIIKNFFKQHMLGKYLTYTTFNVKEMTTVLIFGNMVADISSSKKEWTKTINVMLKY